MVGREVGVGSRDPVASCLTPPLRSVERVRISRSDPSNKDLSVGGRGRVPCVRTCVESTVSAGRRKTGPTEGVPSHGGSRFSTRLVGVGRPPVVLCPSLTTVVPVIVTRTVQLRRVD